jgi:hypothetical protein
MTARTFTILNRFPLHVAATDEGKRFRDTVNGLAEGLDVLARQIGAVRSGHRLGEAPTVADLLGLAAIHGISTAALELVRLRLGDTRHQLSLNLQRTVITGAISAHVIGNATPSALLTAAASYLGLAVETISHTEDRWWHLAGCRDRIAAPGPVPQRDVLALEENPFHAADLAHVARTHAQRFRVLRGGLDDVNVTVRVKGIGSHTVRPMVVHLDSGRGLVFEGNVPDGQELQFTASGQVTLAGADVTGSAWAFTGAVFASATEALPTRDFRFADADSPEADRMARFVVTTPLADAPAPTAAFPHGAPTVGPLRLPVGQSAWACFVRVAHFAATLTDPIVPRTSAGRFDASVFADGKDPSLAVGFAWEEREPFAVRVLLPKRFASLDDEAGTKLRQPLRVLLDRHRAAGVDVRVEYADPRWQLGSGVLRTSTDNPLGTVLAATELWPDGTQQPG